MKRVDHRKTFLLIAGVFAFVFAWRPLLIDGLVPLDGNMIALSFPNWTMARALSADRLLPVWNPWRDMGEPFLADPQTMASYPPMRVLAPLTDFAGFLRLWVVLHTLLAACFMAGLAWKRTRSAPAAAAAAALAGLSGFFTARVTFPNHFAAAAWLPAVLFFQAELSPLGLGVCLALQWLAGFPPFALLSVVATSAVAVAQGRKGVNCLLRGGAWALGLAAVQWIPFLELMSLASRGVILEATKAQQFSIPPAQLLKEVLLPQWSRWLPVVAGDPAIVSFYVGPVACGLALWAAWRGGRVERLIAGGGALALLLSLGAHLPGSSALVFLRIFRFPANWLLLTTTALALLAALGVARLRDERLRWLAVAVLAADLIAFMQVPRAAWSRPEFLSDAPALAGGGKGRIYHTDELRRVWEKGTLETEDDYLLMRDGLAPSFGAAFGVAEANSYQTLRLKRADEYLRRLSAQGEPSSLADWAGIERVVGLKRGAARVTRDRLTVARRTTARDRLFWAEKGVVGALASRPGFASAAVESAGGGTVVLSEMSYPGWTASVDGRESEPEVFAGAFPAVVVPPGTHDVSFDFRSRSARLGLAISLLSAAAFVFAAGVQWRRKRRPDIAAAPAAK